MQSLSVRYNEGMESKTAHKITKPSSLVAIPRDTVSLFPYTWRYTFEGDMIQAIEDVGEGRYRLRFVGTDRADAYVSDDIEIVITRSHPQVIAAYKANMDAHYAEVDRILDAQENS